MKKKETAKKTKKDDATPNTDAKALLFAERVYTALPPITDVARRAFRGRTTDAACDALGLETRSDLVVGDGLRWVAAMAPVIEKAPRGLAYSPARFAWFIERVVSLYRARQQMLGQQDKTLAARTSTKLAAARGVAARNDLLAALKRLAGDVPNDVKAFDAARGSSDNDDALKKSLGQLADLGDAWLGRAAKDAEIKILVDDAGLTQSLVTEACDIVVALSSTGVDDVAAGRLVAYDTPPVNRAEGWVLREMKIAYDAFSEAHGKDATIQKLIPGAGTRRVISRSVSTASAPPASNGAPPAVGSSSAGAVTTTDATVRTKKTKRKGSKRRGK